jgi:mono/diheme cytochrome c family protein
MRSPDLRALMLGAVAAMLACSKPERRDVLALNGSPHRGRAVLQRYGCDACHGIDGLPDPSVPVAAPITDISQQQYIAGTLPTTPANLVLWIRFPQRVKPGTAMPDLAVSDQDARDIATYLYSLR